MLMPKYIGKRGERFDVVSSSIRKMYPEANEKDILYQMVTSGTRSEPDRKSWNPSMSKVDRTSELSESYEKSISYNEWVMYVFQFFGSKNVREDARSMLTPEDYKKLAENLNVLSRYIYANQDVFLTMCGDRERYNGLFHKSRNIVRDFKNKKASKPKEPEWTERDEKRYKRKGETLKKMNELYG